MSKYKNLKPEIIEGFLDKIFANAAKKAQSDAIKKSLKSKKKALKEIKNQKFKKKDISAKDAANFLKKYKGKK